MKKREKLEINLDFFDDKNDSIEPSIRSRNSVSGSFDYGNGDVMPRPWVRYWARYIDIIVLTLFIGIFLASSVSDMPDIVLSVLSLFFWIFIESILLSSWGTTPGKWLLRISVKNKDNSIITFPQALNRSFAVWLKGLGMGIPFVTLFTHISAYNQLSKNGTTTWDRDGGFIVLHNKIGFLRGLITFLLLVIFLLLIVAGESQS